MDKVLSDEGGLEIFGTPDALTKYTELVAEECAKLCGKWPQASEIRAKFSPSASGESVDHG